MGIIKFLIENWFEILILLAVVLFFKFEFFGKKKEIDTEGKPTKKSLLRKFVYLVLVIFSIFWIILLLSFFNNCNFSGGFNCVPEITSKLVIGTLVFSLPALIYLSYLISKLFPKYKLLTIVIVSLLLYTIFFLLIFKQLPIPNV
ncbi:hypothetical protein ACFL06_01870 [Patescibacteria group bacterium]